MTTHTLTRTVSSAARPMTGRHVELMLLCVALAACGGGGGGGSEPGAPPPPPVANAAAPVLSSGSMATVLSGVTGAVYTASATDADGQALTYSIGGADAALFAIDTASGALRFKSPPDATRPASADGDNAYEVTVTASDGSKTDSRDVMVVVSADTGSRPMRWTNANFGGGGYVSGVVFHPALQGLVYARTDVGGVYRRDPGSSIWVPLNDDLGRSDADLQGVLSVAIDPNDADKLYLATGMYLPDWAHLAAVFRSSDRGATWQRTDLPIRLGGNSDGRGTGERLAVDPNKGSILFLGTSQDGLYRSTDSGATWAKVSGFAPTATTLVLFDRASGSAGTATPAVYVGVATTTGPSLYRSTDGGTTWAAVSGGPSGLMPHQAALASDGQLYLAYGNALGPNGVTDGAVWKLATATQGWTNVTPLAPNPNGIAFGYAGISVSASDPLHVIVSTLDRWSISDDIYRSADGGASWTGLAARSTRTAPGHPWMRAIEGGSIAANRLGHWMTDVEIDPFDADHAMFNTGGGIWETSNLQANALNWLPGVDGLEETCNSSMVSPRKGAQVMVTVGDVGGIRYATNDFTDNSGHFPSLISGLSVDVAELDPNIAVYSSFRTGDQGGAYLSRDNGVSWSAITGRPAGATSDDNGVIVPSAKATSLLWVPPNASAYYSTDSGKTWSPSNGYTTTTGSRASEFLRPVADRAADGYFYTYDHATGRLLESGDGGKSFSVSAQGLDVVPNWESVHQLVSIPGGKRRDLWLATSKGLTHIDGPQATPTKLAGFDLAYAVGYGAPAPGKTYPALYLSGTVNGSYGLWRSDDKAASWVRISDAQHQFGAIVAISGDARNYGRVYLGTGCRGLIVGDR